MRPHFKHYNVIFPKKNRLCPTKWGDVFVDSFSTVSQYPTVYYDLLSDIDDAFSIVYPPFGRTEPKNNYSNAFDLHLYAHSVG